MNRSTSSKDNNQAYESEAISSEFTFNGYTNHWQNVYQQQYRYGNLYRLLKRGEFFAVIDTNK